MLTYARSPVFFFLLTLLVHTAAFAGVRASDTYEDTNSACLRMTVSANDIASFGNQGRQHYRIRFENRCDSLRIVYWCAESTSKTLSNASVCVRGASPQAGVAAPLYAVVRQREFQWTFPPGTRIRYVDCSDSAYPTSDFRCKATGQRR
jgi:hypothetical protein